MVTGIAEEARWAKNFATYASNHPDLHKTLSRLLAGEMPKQWSETVRPWFPRNCSHDVLNSRVASTLPTNKPGMSSDARREIPLADICDPSSRLWLAESFLNLFSQQRRISYLSSFPDRLT